MPPELPNDEVLNLKKRARRRLVGAIALVLLMVIVLPMILQDRASLAPQDAIKIIMPNVADANVNNQVFATPIDATQISELPIAVEEPNSLNVVSDETIVNDKVNSVKNQANKESVDDKNLAANLEKKAEVKEIVTKLAKEKPAPTPTEFPVGDTLESKVQGKIKTSFTIQVGVYSDSANVKQLQAKLKDAGYASHAEKIATAKGEKIRVRAGNFPSRQEATDALVKLQKAGLSGMVISNE